MKTVFILNPQAGKGKGLDKIKETVAVCAKELGKEAGTYLTKNPGDAEKLAYLAADEAHKSGDKVRLIACGGDGTLNEVINGAAGFESAEILSGSSVVHLCAQRMHAVLGTLQLYTSDASGLDASACSRSSQNRVLY